MQNFKDKDYDGIVIDFTKKLNVLTDNIDYVKDPEPKYLKKNQERDQKVNEIIAKDGEKVDWRHTIYNKIATDISNHIGYGSEWNWFTLRHGWEKTLRAWMLVKTYILNNDPAQFIHANWEMILQRACLDNWREKFDQSLIDYKDATPEKITEEIQYYLLDGDGMNIYPGYQWMGAAFLLAGLEEEEKFKLEQKGGIKYYFETYGFEKVKNNFLLFKPLLKYDGIHILKFLPLFWWDEWWLNRDFYQLFLKEEAKFLKLNKRFIEKEKNTPLFVGLD